MQLREYYSANQYEDFINELEGSDYKKEEINRLLYLVNLAKIKFHQEKFDEASQLFYKASEYLDKLYKTKISGEVLSFLGNDSSLDYVGFNFERSMIFHYLTITNLKLFSQAKPNKKSEYLFRARAAVVSWNGFFENLKQNRTPTNLYIADFNAKIMASYVHELIGSRNELQIALKLYQQAEKILRFIGPTFETFNSDYKAYTEYFFEKQKDGFNEDFLKNLLKKPIDREKFSEGNFYAKSNSDFIKSKILTLSKKLRPRLYKQLMKDKEYQEINHGHSEGHGEIKFIFDYGTVKELKAKEIEYSINSAIENMEDEGTKRVVENIGLPILTLFAMGPLGLGYFSQSGNTYFYARHDLGTQVVRHIGINFEMPMVENVEIPKGYFVKAIPAEKGKEPLYFPVVLNAQVSELLRHGANERATMNYTKVGVRVALKHLTAILAAFATYNATKENSGELLARALALTQYMGSTKVIKETESADARYWPILPDSIFSNEASLPIGKYKTELVYKVKKEYKTLKVLDEITVEDSKYFRYYKL